MLVLISVGSFFFIPITVQMINYTHSVNNPFNEIKQTVAWKNTLRWIIAARHLRFSFLIILQNISLCAMSENVWVKF